MQDGEKIFRELEESLDKRPDLDLDSSLLCDPNPNSPANSEAARMFSEYNRRVREIVEQSWTTD